MFLHTTFFLGKKTLAVFDAGFQAKAGSGSGKMEKCHNAYLVASVNPLCCFGFGIGLQCEAESKETSGFQP